MNIKAQAEIDLNNIISSDSNLSNINISSLNYEASFDSSYVGIKSKKEEDNMKNGITINSSYGPLKVSLDVLSNDINNLDTQDLDFIISGKYKVDPKVTMGLKYETNMKTDGYDILSGTIDSNLKLNNVNLELNTENIIYGKKTIDETDYTLYGNIINPSIGNENLKIGYKYKNLEKIDEYGNVEENCSSKICGKIDLSLMH